MLHLRMPSSPIRSSSDSTAPPSTPKCETADRKKFTCSFSGCGKCFSRSEHLHRHALNHKDGNDTCSRCMTHFHRRDLLDRHMARHKKKDDEAGGEGLGVLATRKKLWKDAEGKIVKARRPSCVQDGMRRRQVRRSTRKESNPVTVVEERINALSVPTVDCLVLDQSHKHKTEEISQNQWQQMATLPSPPISEIDSDTIRSESRDSLSDNLDAIYDDHWPVINSDLPEIFNSNPVVGRQSEYSSSPAWATQQFHTFMGAIGDAPSEDLFRLDTNLHGWSAWNNQLALSRCRDEKVDLFEEKKKKWPTNTTHTTILRRGFGLSTC